MLKKKIIQLITIYLIIASFLGFIYATLLNENKQKQEDVALQQAGVEYIHTLSKLNIYITQNIYFKESKETFVNLQDTIAHLKYIEEEHPSFQTEDLTDIIQKIQHTRIKTQEAYQFIDTINKTNYVVGDHSHLLFEENRKLYFLSALVTHYMPEYLTSILVCHGIAEEYSTTHKISPNTQLIFLEQQKLIHLSLEELSQIITLLQSCHNTQELAQYIEKLQKKTPKEDLFFNHTDIQKTQHYIDTTHAVFSLAYELHESVFSMTKQALQEKLSHLQDREKQLHTVFILLLLLFASLFVIYFHMAKSNIEKNQEIHNVYQILDEYVLYAKTDEQGYINHMSNALARLLNTNLVDHFIGKTASTVLCINDIASVSTQETDIQTLDGSIVTVRQHILPNFDPNTQKLKSCDIYMQNITNERRLQKLSTTDALTQLYNRHKLDNILQGLYLTFKRYNTPFSVILLDIDHFKHINDYYGHITGDEVLKQIALLMKKNIRATDHLGRWGGEEFLIVCEQTTVHKAYTLAEKIRKTIAFCKDFPLDERVTISLGVAQIKHEIDTFKLIKNVDDALYEAKENGRNQTVLASSSINTKGNP